MSNIIIPGRRVLVRHTEFRMGLRGIVQSIEVIRRGIIVRRLGPYPNLITDACLDGIGNAILLDTGFSYCGVGTGNTAPANGQTTLVAQVGARSNSNGGIAATSAQLSGNAGWSRTKVFHFAAGLVNGAALAEIGLFSAAAAGSMFMRQLIKDDLDAPTTITLDAEEELRITYTWELYAHIIEAVDNITIGGVAIDCTSRAHRLASAVSWGAQGMVANLGYFDADMRRFRLAESNVMPSLTATTSVGSLGPSGANVWAAYVNGNHYREVAAVVPTGSGNFALGLGAMTLLHGNVTFATSSADTACITTFTPRVAKDATKMFTLTARVSWGRV